MSKPETTVKTGDESNQNVPIPDDSPIPLESVYDTDEHELDRCVDTWRNWDAHGENENDLTLRDFIGTYVFPEERMGPDEWRRVRKLLDKNWKALNLGWLNHTHYPYQLQGRGKALELRLFEQLVWRDHVDTMRLHCPNCSDGELHDFSHEHNNLQDDYRCKECNYSHDLPWRDVETLVDN